MMNRTMLVALVTLGLTLGLSACGDDGGTPTPDGGMDAARDTGGGGEDSGADGGLEDCEGRADGSVCGEGFICLREACAPSECGDGYVDTGGTPPEACDDGNEIPGDGCEPSICEYTCAEDADCDNGNPCDGGETCNTSLHRCQAGAPVLSVACTGPGGGAGVCAAGGVCAPPGCGDGSTDGDEDCDDMNAVAGDGCEADCTFSCTEDLDCTDGDECTGIETCDVTTHTCNDPADLDCDDGEACTADSCDPATGCDNALIDRDGDGFAVGPCTTPGVDGGDCDDMNNTAYPGAPELCDMIDNDCDMAVDNDTTIVTCYRDGDGDGYGRETSTVDACTCPADHIPPRADGEFDCADGLASANPGQTAWFTRPTCRICIVGQPMYDYNCDGVDTKRWTRTSHSGCSVSVGFCSSGWTGSRVPACGASATFQPCSFVRNAAGVFVCTAGSTRRTTQECH